jgi:transcriptional regulator with XRE-family HTH domain
MSLSIVAKQKFSIEKKNCDSISEMPKSQLRDFLNARIGSKPKMTAMEVSERGGIAYSYISELKSGAKKPDSLTVDAIIRLAKGLNESPAIVFLAAIGKLETGLRDEDLQQTMEEFSRLDKKSRNELEFMHEQFRKMIRERSTRHA